MNHAFTIESEGYERYLLRRRLLPRLTWAAGAAGMIFAAYVLATM